MFILASGFLKQLQDFYFDVFVAVTSEKREKAKLKKKKSEQVLSCYKSPLHI